MENLHVKVENGVETLVIREGEAPKVYNPEKLNITGILDTPFRFLDKRIDTIDQKKCNIIVDRDKMSISLTINDKDYFKDIISGQLEYHPDFIKLGINSGKYRTAIEMAEFIKMNKAFFENRNDAADLVVQLRKFKAKVDKQVEAEFNPNKGDKKLCIQQAVESNIPSTFKVCVPVFKGTEKKVMELETYFNPDDLTCTLICAEANEIAQDYKDTEIDSVLFKISAIAPDIVIMEQ